MKNGLIARQVDEFLFVRTPLLACNHETPDFWIFSLAVIAFQSEEGFGLLGL